LTYHSPFLKDGDVMAKKWTNRNLSGALHFVSGNIRDRRPVFKYDKYCRAFLEELQDLRTKGKCKIIAFVLMPEHFHFVANPKNGDIQTATGILKCFSAKRIVELAPVGAFLNGDENQVWQESFKSLPLWSGWMITQKINYIHANPVKANLCSTAEDYQWTSFRTIYRGETDPLTAVDKVWWREGDQEELTRSRMEWEAEKSAKMLERIEKNRSKHDV